MTQNQNNTSSQKINDFGQKIGGARKDMYAEAVEWAQTVAGITSDRLASAGLSKVVRRPNLEKMAEKGAISNSAAAACWAIWRTIGKKPGYRSMIWAEKARAALDTMAAIMTSQADELPEEVAALPEYRVIVASGWPSQPFTFGRYDVRDYRGSLAIVGGGWYRGEISDDPETIAEQLRTMTAEDAAKAAVKKEAGPALAVYKNRAGVYFIAPEGKPDIVLYSTQDGSDIFNYKHTHRAELCQRYEELKNFPALRRDWNRPRVGKDWRKGEDITPETFAAALPFRGVEFGNWVNQTERAALLNSAFDGFHDLAEVLGIAPEAVTLGGSLAFAFGSRGHSKAMAHYEPARRVINLTKKNGAGCMAHEWFHAVDHYAAGGYSDAHATEDRNQPEAYAILEAIKKMDFYKRSKKISGITGDYWTEGHELTARGFEGVMMYLLKFNNICSDFLANVVGFDEFTAQDIANRSDYYPYPTEEEAAALLPLYVNFLRSVFNGVNVNPEAVSASVKAQEKAKADQAEAERIRAERAAAAQAEAEARTKAAEEEKARQAEELHRKAATSAAAVVDVMTARHFDTIRTTEDAAAVYFCAHLAGKIYAGKVAITADPTEAKQLAEAAPLACINYKYCHNAKRIIVNTWKTPELKSAYRTAPELLKDLRPVAIKNVYLKFNMFESADNVSKAAASYTDSQRTPAQPKNQPTAEETSDNEAPAQGLELVDIAGGVAVLGDSRTTYRNRKAIKAHGAKWNKEAQQWQAVDPEGVASLRAWFGVAAAPESEQLPKPPAVVYVSEPCPPTPSDQKTDEGNGGDPYHGAKMSEWEKQQYTPADWVRPGQCFQMYSSINEKMYTGIITRLGVDCFFYVPAKGSGNDISRSYENPVDNLTPITINNEDDPRYKRMFFFFHRNRTWYETHHTTAIAACNPLS